MRSTRLSESKGRNSVSLRATNLSLVMAEIVARPGRATRADMAARLRSNRSTISRIVDQLIEGGLVVEGETSPGTRGRPGVPLSPAGRGPSALGIEINVDRYALAVMDLAGEVLAARTVLADHAGLSPEDALGEVAAAARDLCADLPRRLPLVGVHLAIPGLVDREGETVLRAPNLRWDGVRPRVHLAGFLEERELDFRVGNDIDASALTIFEELRRDDEPSSFIYVNGEVGIGAAVSLEGQLMTGRHGWASELGHVCVDPRGARCGCGATGCLETKVGLAAVLRAAGCVSTGELVASLESGERRAEEAILEAGHALGQALGSALNLLDITTVVLGGYLGTCLPWLRRPLTSELDQRVLWAPYSSIEVLGVVDAPQRSARGAAMMALSSVVRDPARWLARK